MTDTDKRCQPDCTELARMAALFREGTKRIYDGQGARADMWYFELWHFLGDVQTALQALPSSPDASSFVTTTPAVESTTVKEGAAEDAPPAIRSGVQTAQADYNVGRWLSAALEDPAVCAEMKADINAWFEAHPACTCGGDPDQPASEHDISCPSALSSADGGRDNG